MTTDQTTEPHLPDMTTFMSRLQTQMPTTRIFRIPWPVDFVTDMLRQTIQYQVESRGGTFETDGIAYIRAAAEWLVNPQTPGLYISGLVGNGKTTLLRAIANMININTNLLPPLADGKAPWVSTISATELVKKARKDEEELDEWYRKPMLALDDLGSEAVTVKTYGNILNPAVELLAHRYAKQMFTIVTTNLQPGEIRTNYGDRIADRFNEMMTRINIKVPTYRAKNRRKT